MLPEALYDWHKNVVSDFTDDVLPLQLRRHQGDGAATWRAYGRLPALPFWPKLPGAKLQKNRQ